MRHIIAIAVTLVLIITVTRIGFSIKNKSHLHPSMPEAQMYANQKV